MAPTKKIEFKIVGRSVIANIDKKKYVITTADEKIRAKLKKDLEAFNLRPSDEKKNKLIKAFTPKAEAKKTAATVEKKKKHRAVKEAKEEVRELTAETKKQIKTLHDYFQGDKRLIIKDGDVYYVECQTVPMPKPLVDAFELSIKAGETIDHLLNFWMLVLLNPNPIAREKLFGYIARHKLVVTPHGYFLTYRMVKKTKKTTKDGAPIYTSAHKGEEDYIMGEAFRMKRTDCDEDGANDCSRGLHTGTPDFIGVKLGDGYDKGYKYVEKHNGGGQGTGYGSYGGGTTKVKEEFDESFGNQAVMCLVNPMHVVSVPNSDTRKMRSCELYFIKEVEYSEVVKIQTSDLSVFEDQYKAYESSELKKMLKDADLKGFVKGVLDGGVTKNLKEKIAALKKKINIGGDQINSGLTLEEINKIIQSRIIKKG